MTLPPAGEGVPDADDIYGPSLLALAGGTPEALPTPPEVTSIPLDEAILRSVESLGDASLVASFMGNVLLVGGSVMFPQLEKYLHERLAARLSSSMSPGDIELLALPSDTPADNASWTGASIIPAMPTYLGMPVSRKDWESLGTRALREKCIFRW